MINPTGGTNADKPCTRVSERASVGDGSGSDFFQPTEPGTAIVGTFTRVLVVRVSTLLLNKKQTETASDDDTKFFTLTTERFRRAGLCAFNTRNRCEAQAPNASRSLRSALRAAQSYFTSGTHLGHQLSLRLPE